MANVVFGTINETPLPGGQKMITGYANLASVDTGMVGCNLSNFFLDSSPHVLVGCSNGMLSCWFTGNSASANIQLTNVLSGALVGGTPDYSAVRVMLHGIGKAY